LPSELIPAPPADERPAPISGAPAHIDTGFADRCGNDHGLSPDGNRITSVSNRLPAQHSAARNEGIMT